MGYLFIIGPFCAWTWNWKWLDVVMCPRLARFFVFKVKNLRLMSTKQLTVPSSVFHRKERSILRKENNKTIWTHKIAKGERRKICLLCYVPHALTVKTFLLPAWSPFSFFFVLSMTKKYTWVRLCGCPFLLHPFQNFTCLQLTMKRSFYVQILLFTFWWLSSATMKKEASMSLSIPWLTCKQLIYC